MKFRIKHVDNVGWFAQVKTSWLPRYETIGVHPNGFGLYSEDHIDYPLDTREKAQQRCEEYKKWVNAPGDTTYYYITLDY